MSDKIIRVYKYRDVPYVSRFKKAPSSFKIATTCGTCYRTWDDGVSTALTPTPSGRCPFEHMHTKETTMEDKKKSRSGISMERALRMRNAACEDLCEIFMYAKVHGFYSHAQLAQKVREVKAHWAPAAPHHVHCIHRWLCSCGDEGNSAQSSRMVEKRRW